MRKFAQLLFVLSILSSGLLMACGGRLVPLSPVTSGVVTQTQDPVEVRAALARALQARRFTVEQDNANQMIARLDHRGRVIRIQIDYDGTGYQMSYLESLGMNYQVNEMGQPMIHGNYNRYVSRLERTIQDELGRPQREQQEAIEEAREQQLALEREETRRQMALQEAETDRQMAAQQAETNRQIAVAQAASEPARIRAQAEADRAAAARAQADANRAHAEAEVLRQQPPTIVQYNQAPIVVDRFSFEAADHRRGSITVSPGFRNDPFVTHGRAAGRTPSRRLGMPQGCAGYWTRQPQHYLNLPSGMRYLRVDIESRQDTTLAIVTPDGHVWCDDDTVGTNPRLAGTFPAGTYAVYVGTYQAGARANYDMMLSERQPQRRAQRQVAQQRTQQATPNCQQELLNAGHSPSQLSYCRNAEPHCAQALLRAGQSPSQLSYCRPDVDIVCAQTLLSRGHSASQLSYCRNVDRQCAVSLLQNGNSPSGLSHCRRR